MEFWRDFCRQSGELRHYPRGAYFLRSGETARYFGYVESGYFAYSAIDSEGNEHITGFALINNFAGDYYSSMRQRPAFNDLKAAVDSTVHVIDSATLRKAMSDYPDKRIHLAEELFRTAHQRYLNLYLQTPKERYVALLERCPDIFRHITLRELASYLQITPTHLSRIRKELRDN